MWRVMVVGIVLVVIAGVVAGGLMWSKAKLERPEAATMSQAEVVGLAQAYTASVDVVYGDGRFALSYLISGHTWRARYKDDGSWVVTATRPPGESSGAVGAFLAFVVNDRTGKVTGP